MASAKTEEIEADVCACGKAPLIESRVNSYGGGRHKGKTVVESWDVTCPCKCWVRGYGRSRNTAVTQWNQHIRRFKGREAAEDKLLWDLENSIYRSHAGEEGVERALGRILRGLIAIKKHLGIDGE